MDLLPDGDTALLELEDSADAFSPSGSVQQRADIFVINLSIIISVNRGSRGSIQYCNLYER